MLIFHIYDDDDDDDDNIKTGTMTTASWRNVRVTPGLPVATFVGRQCFIAAILQPPSSNMHGEMFWSLKGKGKAEHFYSALHGIQTTLKCSGMDHTV